MAKTDLTAARLREILEYNPETGVFTWKKPAKNKAFLAGEPAGCLMQIGYFCIRIDQVHHYSHRLAWLYMTGSSPAHNIDHINGDPADNRFCNLREATQGQNMQNRRANRAMVGAFFHKQSGLWYSKIGVESNTLFLGYFRSEVEAHDAYKKAKQDKHPFGKEIRM